MAKDETKPMDMEARFKQLEERNAQLMAALEAKFEQTTQPGTGISRDEFLSGMEHAFKHATKASELLASKIKPENDHSQHGPFEHPEGGLKYPKADIAPKREMIWGQPLRMTELTYAEVLALRDLDASMRRSERRLCHDGKWRATCSDDDLRITISVPVKSIDDRQDLPSFLQIVQELTTQERVPETADLVAELTLLKAQVSELRAAH